MTIATDRIGRFHCVHLACRLSPVSCAARYRLAEQGRKQLAGAPCGNRCNVGRALGNGKPLPDHFEPLVKLRAPKMITNRDKNWGTLTCLQCGRTKPKGSGNNRFFCSRRCAKRHYRPWRPTTPSLGTIMEGY